MPKEFDPFKWSDTGFLDAIDGAEVTVEDAWFEYDDEIADGTFGLKLKVATDAENFDTDEPLFVSCGDGWETGDKDGTTAVREDGTNKTFHARSKIAIFCQSIMENGGEEVLRSRYEDDGAGPTDAAMYKGLRFIAEKTMVNYGDDIGEIPALTCGEFLGAEEKKAKKSGGSKKKSGGAKKASGKKASGKSKPKVDKGIVKSVTEIAEEVVSDPDLEDDELFDTFVERCFDEVEGVAGDDDAEALVKDDGDDGIFGKALAEVMEDEDE